MLDTRSESSKIKLVKYQCTQCGENDTVKYFTDESVVSPLNCWSCHAGYQKTQPGMFAVAEVE